MLCTVCSLVHSHSIVSDPLGLKKSYTLPQCKKINIFLKVVLLWLFSTKSCPILCNPMDCSPPGSSVHGSLQARILEWVVISFSRGSSRPRDQTGISWIDKQILYHWATREAQILVYYILSNAFFCIYLDDGFFFSYSILKYIVTCVIGLEY